MTRWKSKKYPQGELYKTMGNYGKPERKGEGGEWRREFLRQKSNILVWKKCDQLPFSLKQQRVLWADEPGWLVLPGDRKSVV